MTETQNFRTFKNAQPKIGISTQMKSKELSQAAPIVTSFSNRKRPMGDTQVTSSDKTVSSNGRPLASSYSNQARGSRSREETLGDSSRTDKNDLRYQRKSNVVRIDARNAEDAKFPDSHNLVNCNQATCSNSVMSHPNSNDPRNFSVQNNSRSSPLTKVQSAGAMSHSYNQQPPIIPPPTLVSFHASHTMASFSGSNTANGRPTKLPNTSLLTQQDDLVFPQKDRLELSPLSAGITQSDTLPYSHKSRSAHSTSHLHPPTKQCLDNSFIRDNDYINLKPKSPSRVTFASEEPNKKTKENVEPPMKDTEKCLEDISGQEDKDQGECWSKVAKQNNTLCYFIILLVFLLMVCLGVLTYLLMIMESVESSQTAQNNGQQSFDNIPITGLSDSAQSNDQLPSTPIPASTSTTTSCPKEQLCFSDDCVQLAGEIVAKMNKSVDPCQDFYEYSCGGWIANAYRPLSLSPLLQYKSYGVMTDIKDTNDRVLHELLQGTEPAPRNITDAERNAAKFYQSCMDVKTINKLGAAPLKKLLDSQGGWPLRENVSSGWKLYDLVYQCHGVLGQDVFFSINIGVDVWNPTQNILQIGESRILKPKHFYQDAKFMNALKETIRTNLNLLGQNDVDDVVNEIADFEKSLARIKTEQITHDDYRKFTISKLKALCPQIAWLRLIKHIIPRVKVGEATEVFIAGSTEHYFQNLSSLLQDTDKKIIHNYVLWRMAFSQADRLSLPFRQAFLKLQFALSGYEPVQERWSQCLTLTKLRFPKAVGVLFARKQFSANSKAKVESMARQIKNTFLSRLDNLKWLDEPVRNELTKWLFQTEIEVGYEDRFISNPELLNRMYQFPVHSTTYFDNFLESIKSHIKTSSDKMKRKFNSKWGELRYDVTNGYYDLGRNMAIFPAGLLQPPVFNSKAIAALNFGSTGSTIGHELIHAVDRFQNMGLHENRTRKKWFSETVSNNYDSLKNCVHKKYLDFDSEIVGNIFENVADIAGVRLAYDTYKRNKPKEERQILAEFSNEKIFFIGFAQTWCTKDALSSPPTKQAQRNHAMEKYRVLGSLSQFEEFANEFQCPLGSPMNPMLKCTVW
ncbi:unnamed protein product [Clavelina lepadiformis]|uniref:Endothelin-converting enzyme 1 n=1 Tax=Clavelina lepadiformis TaxID=159417 RepID=A0ABP0H4G7_CLALP